MGATEDTLDRIKNRLNTDFPNLKIAGMVSPPFRPATPGEDAALTDQINASGASFVLVALGCPNQEKWMHRHYGSVNAVMLGIGWAFIVYAGLQKRAPHWMQKYSLEWFYRLMLEPRRLFKRYFYTNTMFLLLILKQCLTRRTD